MASHDIVLRPCTSPTVFNGAHWMVSHVLFHLSSIVISLEVFAYQRNKALDMCATSGSCSMLGNSRGYFKTTLVVCRMLAITL